MVVYGGGPSRGMDFEELNEMVGDGIMLPRFASPPPPRLPASSASALPPPFASCSAAFPCPRPRLLGLARSLATNQLNQPARSSSLSHGRASERRGHTHTMAGWLGSGSGLGAELTQSSVFKCCFTHTYPLDLALTI